MIKNGGVGFNMQQSGVPQSTSWVPPESEKQEEEIPRIPRLCLMDNTDDKSTEEAKYDSEMCILKATTVSRQLRDFHVKSWFKTHAPLQTLPFYLKSGSELVQELNLERLFLSFDEDGSNSLDVGEMRDMFLSSGVDISLEDCLTLFKFVDEDGSGALSVDEFKLFLKSEEANDSK